MYVALIVLIAMTIAGVAMMRQMSTGVSVAGNLAFKQNATSVGDLGIEKARDWIVNPVNAAALDSDSSANGYYSSWNGGATPAGSVEPKEFNWNDGSKLVTSDDGTGNEVRYIIHRLCKIAGKPPNESSQQCTDSGKNVSVDKGGSSTPPTRPPQPYFRVTARVLGPRNTVSYIQVVLAS